MDPTAAPFLVPKYAQEAQSEASTCSSAEIHTVLQYNESFSAFLLGNDILEDSLYSIAASNTYSMTELSLETEALLLRAKGLSSFLDSLVSRQKAAAKRTGRRLRQSESTWLTSAIIDLRLQCHRYSMTVFHAYSALERQMDMKVPYNHRTQSMFRQRSGTAVASLCSATMATPDAGYTPMLQSRCVGAYSFRNDSASSIYS
jgi:hypothetical protein